MSTSRFTAFMVLNVLLLAAPAAYGAEVQSQEGVKFVTGGVGDDERKTLEAMSNQFNLKVTLALADGHFLGDAKLRITAGDGQTVLDAATDGPLFYAQLKPDTYTVTVSREGKELKQTVHVTGNGQQKLTFTWRGE